jgi:hypothetical protein
MRTDRVLVAGGWQLTFQTKVYHPGINNEGHICVPVLRDQVRWWRMRDVGSSANGYLVEAHCDHIEWYVILLSFHLCRVPVD